MTHPDHEFIQKARVEDAISDVTSFIADALCVMPSDVQRMLEIKLRYWWFVANGKGKLDLLAEFRRQSQADLPAAGREASTNP